jgi:hypothetical protein
MFEILIVVMNSFSSRFLLFSYVFHGKSCQI